MTSHDILNLIGDARGQYIWEAQQHRTGKAASPSLRSRRLLLLVAVLVALTATACAAKYVHNLFVDYFEAGGQPPLTDSQIGYIETNLQESIAAPLPTEDGSGYSVQVRSALTDGKTAYLILDITAPEDTAIESWDLSFGTQLLIPDRAEGLVLAPDGSSMDALCTWELMDDGDGLANTASLLFPVNPFLEDDSLFPFDGSIRWRIHLEDLRMGSDVIFQKTWDMDLAFREIDAREVEFVSEPVPIMTSDWIRNEYDLENEITSFVLSGLSYRMELKIPRHDGKEMEDVGNVTIVMKDGSSQTLICLTAQSAGLNAPIVLEEVDHILLANGVKLYAIE